jgi:hypothetical protein
VFEALLPEAEDTLATNEYEEARGLKLLVHSVWGLRLLVYGREALTYLDTVATNE